MMGMHVWEFEQTAREKAKIKYSPVLCSTWNLQYMVWGYNMVPTDLGAQQVSASEIINFLYIRMAKLPATKETKNRSWQGRAIIVKTKWIDPSMNEYWSLRALACSVGIPDLSPLVNSSSRAQAKVSPNLVLWQHVRVSEPELLPAECTLSRCCVLDSCCGC